MRADAFVPGITGIDDRPLSVEVGNVVYCVHDEFLLPKLRKSDSR